MFTQENLNKASLTLMVMAVGWLFIQSLRVDPVVKSVDNLAKSILHHQKESSREIARLTAADSIQNTRMSKNEVKLYRVMRDCTDNKVGVQKCKEHINFYSLPPYKILKDK